LGREKETGGWATSHENRQPEEDFMGFSSLSAPLLNCRSFGTQRCQQSADSKHNLNRHIQFFRLKSGESAEKVEK